MAGYLRVVGAAVTVASLLVPHAAARAHGDVGGRTAPTHQRSDRAEQCDDHVPAALATTPTGNGQPIELDILVLQDGVAKIDAESIVAASQRSYSPLNIKLDAIYKKATFVVEAPSPTGSDVIAAAKLSLDGIRPLGTDVVHVLTTKNISVANDRDAVGYSDCHGGVRYPTRAFSVSEAIIPAETLGPLNLYIEAAAKTLSHEVGHLLGARHEHSNCAEGVGVQDISNREPSPCTVMFTYADFQSLNFGTPEALVVRGHAENYAAP